MKNDHLQPELPGKEAVYTKNVSRKKFLSVLGIGGLGLAAVASCSRDDDGMDNTVPPGSIDLGKGDTGILNYAYALEQLEAAFYTKVAASPYSGITAAETALLTDIRDHEVAHREFFKKALGAAAIPALNVNFSAIDFGKRDSVLATAKAFEDLGVSAYNGAGALIADKNYLALAGKIVSVEARHAAYIRDLISNGSFADSTVIDANGMDKAQSPADVLMIAQSFLTSKLWGGNLPQS
ncbi:ferritin-like domain-containing protein [Niabella beijingensis]|uniref:ferritin-like domain-containing protein n=1 Tax=Niabella beijingensis TaxID=2872700 RepID=UPI001CBDFB66|nr:ferritin-like domain-containing protein [Niabella beijingensis]MBZ4189456.1 ferritin-like domain-containing protein [Niabella beijingensis]